MIKKKGNREMNIAIIIAGGVGSRMGQDLPKQFINVYDKPVLLYTLEGFQKHPQIDAILMAGMILSGHMRSNLI